MTMREMIAGVGFAEDDVQGRPALRGDSVSERYVLSLGVVALVGQHWGTPFPLRATHL